MRRPRRDRCLPASGAATAPPRRALAWRFAALAALCALPALGAAELKLEPASQVSYGDTVALTLQVINPDGEVGNLSMPPVDGLAIQGPYRGGRQESMRIVGNRRETTITYTYQYRVTPRRGLAGTFTLGPVTMDRPGQAPLRSNAAQLGVYSKPELGLRFRAELSQDEGEVSAPVTVTYTLSFPEDAMGDRPDLRLDLPLLEMSGTAVTPRAARPGRPASRQAYGDTALFLQEDLLVLPDGTAEKALVFAFEIIPMKTGELRFPPASASAVLLTGETQMRRDFIFGRTEVPVTRRFSARTEELVYRVKPLPVEGRPPGFTGAVGRYRIRVTTEDTDVGTFDPIELEIRVEGSGLLDDLAAPAWTQVEELTRDFEVSRDVDSGRVEDGAKIFRQTIRPRSERVKEIPPLPFPYYDPQLKKYAVARSEAIPITVRATRTVGAGDAYHKREPSRGGAEANAQAAPLIFEQAGVEANFEEMGSPARYLEARERLSGWPFLVTLSAPPLLCALLALALGAARRSPQQRARDRAHIEAHAALARAGADPEAISAAYQDFFRRRLSLPPGEITPAQLRSVLGDRGIDEGVSGRAAALLEVLLAARFGGGATPAEDLRSDALSILKETRRCGV